MLKKANWSLADVRGKDSAEADDSLDADVGETPKPSQEKVLSFLVREALSNCIESQADVTYNRRLAWMQLSGLYIGEISQCRILEKGRAHRKAMRPSWSWHKDEPNITRAQETKPFCYHFQ